MQGVELILERAGPITRTTIVKQLLFSHWLQVVFIPPYKQINILLHHHYLWGQWAPLHLLCQAWRRGIKSAFTRQRLALRGRPPYELSSRELKIVSYDSSACARLKGTWTDHRWWRQSHHILDEGIIGTICCLAAGVLQVCACLQLSTLHLPRQWIQMHGYV